MRRQKVSGWIVGREKYPRACESASMRVYFYVVIDGVIIEFWQIAEKLFLSSTLRNHITLKLKLSRETYKPWIDPQYSAMTSISSVIVSFIVVVIGK